MAYPSRQHQPLRIPWFSSSTNGTSTTRSMPWSGLWRAGDEDWTARRFELEPDSKFRLTYNNPVFFEGEFYCLGDLGNLAVFSPSDMEFRVLDKLESIYDDDDCRVGYNRCHLVEFRGELIAVFVPQHEIPIEMFKLDRSQMAWTKLERLDDATMFVHNQARRQSQCSSGSAATKVLVAARSFDEPLSACYFCEKLRNRSEKSMAREQTGRRGIPSLLKSSSSEKGGLEDQEHIASDVTQLIGWTPLIELKRITSKDGINARIVSKMEAYQPLGSIKDRCALRIIEDAEEKGLISPGVTTLLAQTTGNLGLGLVLIAIHKGYKFAAVMPGQYSLDKEILLRYMGAEVFLSGPEIWMDTAGKVDIFVPCSGTGGTISGVGKYLKMQNPNVKIICVEPAESPVISGGDPGKHKIQGIGPGFLPETLDTSVLDEVVTMTSEEVIVNARRLAKEEGLLVGISSGANLAACLKVASREENQGKMIVTMFPSRGEGYMSTDLFAAAREECSATTV
ncbi:hypothetical protein PR202_ga18142 [Eleusine coracana subsp. coracana]|uniref:Cysteine synthase n=1 Tax=Eleusine coracana subsp. coracana TaxID=191504 RepID=A0AAV5CSE0_ELECO|nr:hypothetical protein PR202_ga18142 [Eleusine coracana subsp. coracana]